MLTSGSPLRFELILREEFMIPSMWWWPPESSLKNPSCSTTRRNTSTNQLLILVGLLQDISFNHLDQCHLIRKDEVKHVIKSKVYDLCRKNDKLLLMNSRLHEINTLIKINKKSQNLMVANMGKIEADLDFTVKPQGQKPKKSVIVK